MNISKSLLVKYFRSLSRQTKIFVLEVTRVNRLKKFSEKSHRTQLIYEFRMEVLERL